MSLFKRKISKEDEEFIVTKIIADNPNGVDPIKLRNVMDYLKDKSSPDGLIDLFKNGVIKFVFTTEEK